MTSQKWLLKPATVDPVTKAPVHVITLNYGNLIRAAFNFLIIAFTVLGIVRLFQKIQHKKRDNKTPLALSKTEQLRSEIRGIIEKQRQLAGEESSKNIGDRI